MISNGAFTMPIIWNENLLGGSLGVARPKSNKGALNLDNSKYEFTSTDKSVQVNLEWFGKSKVKGTAVMQIFNSNNKKISDGKPLIINVSPKDILQSNWTFDPSQLTADVYRVDVVVDNVPIWRSFFKLTK